MKVLVTGCAGFIGFHVIKKLLARGDQVIGIDNLNNYYSVALKKDRLKQLQTLPGFEFHEMDISNREDVESLFANGAFERVVHLAAQAGVRYSLENPRIYIESNVQGFLNILEGCRAVNTKHLVYASTSSVYGLHTNMPFSEHQGVDHPISLYAATKKSNELMAHSYSYLFQMPVTGLRFFTVYGPWGRPDMALFLFTKAILKGEPIQVFNNGEMVRDFTYVEDIAEGVVRSLDKPPTQNSNWDSFSADPATSSAPYRIYNIGNNNPVKLMDFIEAIERATGKKAVKQMMPMQAGDVPATFANVDDLMNDVGFKPATPVVEGITNFVKWYREYYKV